MLPCWLLSHRRFTFPLVSIIGLIVLLVTLVSSKSLPVLARSLYNVSWQTPPVAITEPFAPSGHFETAFLPEGKLITLNKNSLVLFNYDNWAISNDAGKMWQTLSDPAYYANENVLVASPNVTKDGTFIVGLDYGFDALRVSSDRGLSWHSPAQPIPGPISAIGISESFQFDKTVYAASGFSPNLYRSIDGGDHWQNVAFPSRNSKVEQIILSPSYYYNQTLYIRLSDESLWRSTNGGSSWSRADNGLGTDLGNQIFEIEVVPIDLSTDVFLATTLIGTAFSLDGGQTWYLLSPMLFSDIAAPPDFAYTGTLLGIERGTNKLFYSTDLGANWQEKLPGEPKTSLSISPNYAQDRTLYVRSQNNVWVSHDSGASWQQSSNSTPDVSNIYQIVVSPEYETDGTIFAAAFLPYGSSETRILKSVDYGQNWSISEVSGVGYVTLALSPGFANDQTIFAIRGDRLYRSENGGNQWTIVSTLPFSPFWSSSFIHLSPNYSNDKTVFVGHYGAGLYRSTNDGGTWSLISNNLSDAVTDFAISPGYPTDPTLFLSIYNLGIYRSDDMGMSWTSLNKPDYSIVEISPNFDQDNTLFIANSTGVLRSSDRGETWTNISGEYLNYYVRGLAVSPQFESDQTIIAYKEFNSVYISEDAGTSWFPLRSIVGVDYILHIDSLTIAYKDGLLQPIASSKGVQLYNWPKLALPPTFIGIPMDPNNLQPGSTSLKLDEAETVMYWSADEGSDWLTIEPTSGTLATAMTLTADPHLITDFADTSMSLKIYYSTNQAKSYNVTVRAFFANHSVFMPVIESQ